MNDRRKPSAGIVGAPTLHDYGTVTTAQSIDPSTADVHVMTLGANVAVTLSTMTVPDRTVIRVFLTQDGTGSRQVSSWTGVTWLNGSTPALRTPAAAYDLFEFTFVNSLTTWVGRYLTNYLLVIPGNIRLGTNATFLQGVTLAPAAVDLLGVTANNPNAITRFVNATDAGGFDWTNQGQSLQHATMVAGLLTTAKGLLTSGPTNGVGYVAGAGGAVTQATNKTTAVTLNKVTGAITLNNAALAAGASVTFTVNNSTVLTGDVPLAVHASAGTAGAYRVEPSHVVNATSFDLTVTNITGGSLSEAIVLNVALLRGASS